MIIRFAIAVLVLGAQAEAAEIKEVPNLKALLQLQLTMGELCSFAASSDECFIDKFKVTSKKPGEKWENILKQMALVNEAVHTVTADRLEETEDVLRRAFGGVVRAAGISETEPKAQQAVAAVLARLEQDVIGQTSIIALGGSQIGDDHFNQRYIAVVHVKSGETIFFRAGPTF